MSLPMVMYNGLSPREQETLKLISEGWDNDAIANIMDIRVKTVENYIHGLLQTFPAIPGKHNRVSLVLWVQYYQYYMAGC